jgi:hypothetical protein
MEAIGLATPYAKTKVASLVLDLMFIDSTG